MSPPLVLFMFGNKSAGIGLWIERASSAVLERSEHRVRPLVLPREPSYEVAQREIYFAAMPFSRWKQ